MKLLVKSGANFETRDNQRRTPLLYYIQNHDNLDSDLEMVREFVKQGASLNVADNQGKTPLMSYLQFFDSELDTIKELVRLGASLNAKDNNGKSALDYYIEHCQDHEEIDNSDEEEVDEDYEKDPDPCDHIAPEILQYLSSANKARQSLQTKSRKSKPKAG